MVTRKTQYGWMATGGLICLFAVVLACKLREGNKAIAQAEPPTLPETFTGPLLPGKGAPDGEGPSLGTKASELPPIINTGTGAPPLAGPAGHPLAAGSDATPPGLHPGKPIPPLNPPSSGMTPSLVEAVPPPPPP